MASMGGPSVPSGSPPWGTTSRRAAVLAHERLGSFTSKTAVALIRYGRDRVVAAIDRSKAVADASEYLGRIGEGIPVVPSVRAALAHEVEVLHYGFAPEGGGLPSLDRAEMLEALRAGVDVACGMHVFLGDDAEFAATSRKSGARIWDVRRPPARRRLLTGEGASVSSPVVYVSGTDCSTGKMTVAVELVLEARRRGMDAAFVATGQTGMMIGCDAGSPVDAMPGDFVAGETEALVLEVAARRPDIIVVEGQAALYHPAYGSVTMGLVYGSFPRAVVMCHDPSRRVFKAFWDGPVRYRIPPISEEVALTERMLESTSGGKVVAVAVMESGATPDEELSHEAVLHARLGLPVADVFRGGSGTLLDAVLEAVGRGAHGRNRT